MEFLARIEQNIAPDMDPVQLAEVKAAEKVRGQQLVDAGKLLRIWRLPGRRAVMALYDVESADELHELISSLPLFPWMDVTITALGAHALDPHFDSAHR